MSLSTTCFGLGCPGRVADDSKDDGRGVSVIAVSFVSPGLKGFGELLDEVNQCHSSSRK